MKKKTKVLVAMSGGVDSSVSAALLVKAGYDVTGMFAVNYDDDTKSCWTGDYRDALRVSAKLGIPLVRLDFTKEYKQKVLDYMYKEYQAGRTPNPDVLCNKFIKFGVWLDWAKKHGFEYLATGHYARIKKLTINKKQLTKVNDTSRGLLIANCSLLLSKDIDKDQTYFLHQLSQKQLKYVLFPVGEYLKSATATRRGPAVAGKSDVRALAKKFDLPTANKEESMGICFVGEVPMKEFLKIKIKTKIGDIVLSSSVDEVVKDGKPPVAPLRNGGGLVIGKHDGVAFYTIGQRIGVNCHPRESGDSGLSSNCLDSRFRGNDRNQPFYVVDKNIKKNELIVGFEDDPLLYKKEANIGEVNWISGQPPKFPLKCEVRLRHRQPLQKCVVRNSPLGRGRGGLVVQFDGPQRAVTPGQFAVFYKKDECLGGGVVL